MNSLLETFVSPFKEEETPNQVRGDIDVASALEKLEKAKEILEAIETFKERKYISIDGINGFVGTFPRLRAEAINRIDTYNKCINRLYERYEKLMANM